ncbi:MAG: AIR synthase-related protein, partial [Anaerolineales bacterium]
ELECTVGEELLRPTRIYVSLVKELLSAELPIRAMVNITSDGFLNLARIEAPVGFTIEALPAPQAIYQLIQDRGPVSDAEMFRVFNMGVGFCAIVPDDSKVIASVLRTAEAHDCEAFLLGHTVEDSDRRVLIPQKNLVGKDDRFHDG